MNAAELIRRACPESRAAVYLAAAERQLRKLQAIHNGQPPQGAHARKAK